MQALATTSTTVFSSGSLRAAARAQRPVAEPAPSKYSTTFIFIGHGLQTSPHAFADDIAAAARAIPGFIGEQAWANPATGLDSRVFYWSSIDALELLLNHPAQRAAEAAQGSDLDGYRVVVAEVDDLGDDTLAGAAG
ncbi:hypothetical protein [Derxia lacustris]|uniref:hypothetical protein n=1 Tax=Derxia lacustris TaxID=764842 RepID=UPI000A171EC4|nr:hypothetical protein [Derxia lacustris]